jgi:hypothetical protein
MRFNTFDQVAEWYNNTKPLGGKDNKGLDIRPIGARRYKYERIKKYDEDTYALIDGYFDPDRHSDEEQGYALDMTAILWSRRDSVRSTSAYAIYPRGGLTLHVLSFTATTYLARCSTCNINRVSMR